ncbi:hypothetical protein FF1_006629 [Malus domestica]
MLYPFSVILHSHHSAMGVQFSTRKRSTLMEDYLVYVSTYEDLGVSKTSSVTVYSTFLDSCVTRRLTPYGTVDFSSVVSPFGVWTVVASYGPRG